MKFSKDDLIFIPLGGSSEIGMNSNLYHFKNRWIMVDLGISFPDDNMPGIDIVLPDLTFIEERKANLEAIILTHAHEDHFGAIPYLWQKLKVPVYGSPFTIALLRRKLSEARSKLKVPLITIDYNTSLQLGPFSIEFINLTHSIPDPTAITIRTSKGLILHTGDWKFDASPIIGNNTDKERLKQIGEEGVLAMVGDSTNSLIEGHSNSEEIAKQALEKIIKASKNTVAVTCFASNIARISSILSAANKCDRNVCIVGRSLNRAISAAKEVGYLKNLPDLVNENNVNLIPKEKLLIICTGTQGEPRSAMSKIAFDNHENISLNKDDTVIFSSRKIPGNEQSIDRVQNMLIKKGINLITDEDDDIHVSGHPSKEEMIEMYSIIRPKIAIPVHGMPRHLDAHAKIAKMSQVNNVFIPENGSVIRLNNFKKENPEKVKTGLLTYEGGELVDLSSDIFKSRRRLLWNGTLTASIVLNNSNKLLLAPQITQSGIISAENSDDFIAELSIYIEDEFLTFHKNELSDDIILESKIKSCIRKFIKIKSGLRSEINIHLIRA